MVRLAGSAVHAQSAARGVDDAEVLWRPPAGARETARMGRYMTWLADTRGLSFDSYAQLWEWSVTDLAGFWASIWDFFEFVPKARIRTSWSIAECRVPNGSRALNSTTPNTR